ncbi:MAG: response regulator [candidate division KSB1 bacterium]|nr:response regulator [candidate division KSB1 bacterium]MDZ7312488.1 response regulator [candidate division KSB1 bacterium]
MNEAKLKKQRQEALDIGLRLDYTNEAKSLKRVQVENPKAKILAVDDEEIVLDSIRKILVLAGYSVDTVETGKEAVGLVQRNDYDFVFTDLKMPEMDGLEVTKAVKYLRPDIDVIVITGFATIESAVEAMKFGAMDYIQKPFSEGELVEFVSKSLIRRQEKIEKEIRPKIHLVTPSSGELPSEQVYNVPAGVFVSPEHTWLSIELNGAVKIGIDDFAQKIIGQIDEIVPPPKGKNVKRGDPLFSIKQNSRTLTFPSPVSGKVTSINTDCVEHVEILNVKLYEVCWICCIEPTNLSQELRRLRIGADALSWYQDEFDRFQDTLRSLNNRKPRTETVAEGKSQGQITPSPRMDNENWEAFSKAFLHTQNDGVLQ